MATATAGIGAEAYANACFSRSDVFNTGPVELLARAEAAYLVQVRRIETEPGLPPLASDARVDSMSDLLDRVRADASRQVDVTFDVVETLHGPNVETYELTRIVAHWHGGETTFDHHNNREFWSDPGAGRAIQGRSCDLHAVFETGATYLIVETDPPTVKCYERIDDVEADRWLAFARAHFTN